MTMHSDANTFPPDQTIEVLNFEDNPVDALLVQRSLKGIFLMNFRVTTVASLANGLERLRTQAFDVALLDLHLPDACGMETFNRLRNEAPDLPLIVLTGNHDDKLAGQILREGAQDYLLKHEATGPMLAKAIRYAIERHRVRIELNSRAAKLARSEETLRQARNRYFALFDRAPIGYLVFDASHSIKAVNTAGADVFAIKQTGDWDSCFYTCLPRSSREAFAGHLKQTFAGERKQVVLIHIRCHDNTHRQLHFESQLLQDETEGGAQCLSIFVDLTEQKHAESQLAKALAEKTVLLKEIHHRVKNNLQIISSLLNLQSRLIKDRQTLEIFRESCDRVQLMALIHEKLYAGGDLSQLDFNEYLRSLAAMILRSHATQSRNINIIFRFHHQLHLTLDTAIPLGLIANELISNCLKHAFSPAMKGSITLELENYSDSHCVFRVRDDGRGLPSKFSISQPATLGLRLVKMLAEQLKAELTWTRTPCTLFALVFQKQNDKRRNKNEPVFA